MYFELAVVAVLVSWCSSSKLPLEVFQHQPNDHHIHHHRIAHNTTPTHRKKTLESSSVRILYQVGVSLYYIYITYYKKYQKYSR